MPDDLYDYLKNIVYTTVEQEIWYKQLNDSMGK